MKQTIFFISLVVLLSFASCNGSNTHSSSDSKDEIEIKYAKNLKIFEHDNYTEVVMINPWDTAKIFKRYYLLPHTAEIPSNIANSNGIIVRVPLQRSIVYSNVHCGLICEFSASTAIVGVCDSKYINHPDLKKRLKNGTLIDCGAEHTANIEKIISANADAIILSAYENNSGYGKIEQLGIPIIECVEYMENTPLGRAEWMKFFARLYGKAEIADKMFYQIETKYNKLKNEVSSLKNKPSVLTDKLYGQIWYVPGSASTIGQLYKDAGAKTPFDEYNQAGSIPLSLEQILTSAIDADIWLFRYDNNQDMTISELGAENKAYSQFLSFKKHKVYGCNTKTSRFFEITPFHPDVLLEDLIAIFHPEVTDTSGGVFFKQLSD